MFYCCNVWGHYSIFYFDRNLYKQVCLSKKYHSSMEFPINQSPSDLIWNLTISNLRRLFIWKQSICGTTTRIIKKMNSMRYRTLSLICCANLNVRKKLYKKNQALSCIFLARCRRQNWKRNAPFTEWSCRYFGTENAFWNSISITWYADPKARAQSLQVSFFRYEYWRNIGGRRTVNYFCQGEYWTRI